MTTFEKLAIRIKKDIGYDIENLERTYAGIHMRSSGAYVWISNCKISSMMICSGTSATELLKKEGPIIRLTSPTISGVIEVI